MFNSSGIIDRLPDRISVWTINLYGCMERRSHYEDPIIGKPMDFSSEVEEEVIRYEVLYKLKKSLVNPSNKFWRDSTQSKTPTSTLKIRNYLIYKNKGHNNMVDPVDINNNYPDIKNMVSSSFTKTQR